MTTIEKQGSEAVIEKDIIKAAAVSASKRLEFKRSLAPLAQEIAQMYVYKYSLPQSALKSLTQIGMASFHRAFNNYVRKVNMFEDGSYKFSSYFTWWVRQYIQLYLTQLNLIPNSQKSSSSNSK